MTHIPLRPSHFAAPKVSLDPLLQMLGFDESIEAATVPREDLEKMVLLPGDGEDVFFFSTKKKKAMGKIYKVFEWLIWEKPKFFFLKKNPRFFFSMTF